MGNLMDDLMKNKRLRALRNRLFSIVAPQQTFTAEDTMRMMQETLQEELERIAEIAALDQKDAFHKAWDAYIKHYKTLPSALRAEVGYEMAKGGSSRGQSGFHGMGMPDFDMPFQMYAWAQTKPVPGVAFAINRACFTGRDPLLFYIEKEINDNVTLSEVKSWEPGWAGEIWDTIEGYSSGIKDVTLRGRCILFRLDKKRIKKLGHLSGGLGKEQQEDYIFVWLGAGEFQCTLGEVIDSRLVPLHKDDFCMK